MPKGSKVAQVEAKLKREYPNNPSAVFGTLNKAGLMRGNKPTKKGLQKARKPRVLTRVGHGGPGGGADTGKPHTVLD